MAYRLLNALRRFVLPAAIGALRPVRTVAQPAEPRSRPFGDGTPAHPADDWMFEDGAYTSPAVEALAGELGRVSDKLGELRHLLSRLADHAPLEPGVQMSEVAQANYDWAEPGLFEGEVTMPQIEIRGALEGEASFLFEADEPSAPWGVLQPSLMDTARAA